MHVETGRNVTRSNSSSAFVSLLPVSVCVISMYIYIGSHIYVSINADGSFDDLGKNKLNLVKVKSVRVVAFAIVLGVGICSLYLGASM